MKRTTLTILTLMCLTMSTLAQKAKTVTLCLVETSDVHGAFFPTTSSSSGPCAARWLA